MNNNVDHLLTRKELIAETVVDTSFQQMLLNNCAMGIIEKIEEI
jgi:hypothetical protein